MVVRSLLPGRVGLGVCLVLSMNDGLRAVLLFRGPTVEPGPLTEGKRRKQMRNAQTER